MHFCIWADGIWKNFYYGGEGHLSLIEYIFSLSGRTFVSTRYVFLLWSITSIFIIIAVCLFQGSVDNPGINQLALYELFAKIRCSHSDWKYSVFVSVVEIYNESIHDLLSMDTDKLNIKLKSDGYYIPGLTQVSVSDMEEVNTVCSVYVF